MQSLGPGPCPFWEPFEALLRVEGRMPDWGFGGSRGPRPESFPPCTRIVWPPPCWSNPRRNRREGPRTVDGWSWRVGGRRGPNQLSYVLNLLTYNHYVILFLLCKEKSED